MFIKFTNSYALINLDFVPEWELIIIIYFNLRKKKKLPFHEIHNFHDFNMPC